MRDGALRMIGALFCSYMALEYKLCFRYEVQVFKSGLPEGKVRVKRCRSGWVVSFKMLLTVWRQHDLKKGREVTDYAVGKVYDSLESCPVSCSTVSVPHCDATWFLWSSGRETQAAA